jgi:hypothetical protein
MRRAGIVFLVLVSLLGMVMGMSRGPLAGTGDMLWPLSWVPWPLVGAVILIRRPANRIGIACMVIGVVWGLSFALQSFVLDLSDDVAAWIELVYTVLGIVPWLVIVWLLANFPTGVPAGRLERIIGRAILMVGVWASIGFVLDPTPLSDTGLANPMGGMSSPVLRVITSDAGFAFVVVLAVSGVISLILRLRRSSGIERLQFRWLLLGSSLFVLISAVGQVLPEDSVGELLWLLGGSAIPISIGVAVVRYRLYEIDRLVSRTVSYAIVIALLAVVFAGLVTLVGSYLDTRGDLAVAASTLAVAALFNPLRRRVQKGVDHRFNRSRYDSERVMSGSPARSGTKSTQTRSWVAGCRW